MWVVGELATSRKIMIPRADAFWTLPGPGTLS